jgi:MFS family permease
MSEMTNKKAPPEFYRWAVLFFISLSMFGNYYIYDSISPVAVLLKQQLGFSNTDLGTLNAIYSFPNIFMVLIGGIIIDRIGTKKASLLFAALMMVGGFITAFKGSFAMMVVGRLVFGLGAESMTVAITTAIARWFKGKKLSFAFGLYLFIARAGSFMALNSPSWGKSFYSNWQDPLWIAAFTGVISVVCLIIYWWMDKYAVYNYELPSEGKQDKVVFGELFKFNRSFWYICILCLTFYSAIFPFQTFAVKFFHDVHGESEAVGGFLSSILTVTAMFMTPFFGFFIDRIGRRSLLMMLGSLLLIPVYLLITYKPDIAPVLGLAEQYHIVLSWFNIDNVINTNFLIPMMMMGISFSLIPAIMWPSVALIIEEKKLGTAYGLMTMIQNAGLFVFNLLIGGVNDIFKASTTNPSGYHFGMWIFSSLGCFGFLFALLLRIREKGASSHGLEKGTG